MAHLPSFLRPPNNVAPVFFRLTERLSLATATPFVMCVLEKTQRSAQKKLRSGAVSGARCTAPQFAATRCGVIFCPHENAAT